MALRIPPRPGSIGRAMLVAASVCIAVALIGSATVIPASAQTDFFRFEPRPKAAKKATPKAVPAAAGDKQMMVQATEVQYDHVNERVNAVGNVQIYYGGSTVEADRVIYNQRTKRLRAEGNVRLTEPGGNITYGEILELTRRDLPPRASTAARAATRFCRAASTLRARPARPTRGSRRSGRSRARASSTTNRRR